MERAGLGPSVCDGGEDPELVRVSDGPYWSHTGALVRVLLSRPIVSRKPIST